MTYEINSSVESPVLTDEKGMFVSIDHFNTLKGTITKTQYGNAPGEGRIKIVSHVTVPTETETPTPAHTPKNDETSPSPSPKVTVKRAMITSAKNIKGRKIKVTVKRTSGVKGFKLKYVVGIKFKAKKTKTVAFASKTIVLKNLKKGKVKK